MRTPDQYGYTSQSWKRQMKWVYGKDENLRPLKHRYYLSRNKRPISRFSRHYKEQFKTIQF